MRAVPGKLENET